jgi:hypothetical protein
VYLFVFDSEYTFRFDDLIEDIKRCQRLLGRLLLAQKRNACPVESCVNIEQPHMASPPSCLVRVVSSPCYPTPCIVLFIPHLYIIIFSRRQQSLQYILVSRMLLKYTPCLVHMGRGIKPIIQHCETINKRGLNFLVEYS